MDTHSTSNPLHSETTTTTTTTAATSNFTDVDNPSDIERNKPSRSRFLFLLGFFGFFIFCWAGCYNLYHHKFNANPDYTVPDNTLYNPKYK